MRAEPSRRTRVGRPGCRGCGPAAADRPPSVVPLRVVVPRLVALLDLLQCPGRLGLRRVGPEPVGVRAPLGALDRVVLQAVPEVAHRVTLLVLSCPTSIPC